MTALLRHMLSAFPTWRGHLGEERVVQTLCVHTSISLEYTSHFTCCLYAMFFCSDSSRNGT